MSKLATATLAVCNNEQRLHEALWYVPSAEYEAAVTGISHSRASPTWHLQPTRNSTWGSAVTPPPMDSTQAVPLAQALTDSPLLADSRDPVFVD